MRSSTSSSDPYSYEDRPIPEIPWKKALILGLVLMALGIAAWEYNARVIWGYETGYYIDSPGLWSIERRKVDRGEAEVAVVGSSRILFDLDLDTYQQVTGVRPVMLALVGTNPRPFLGDLAADDDFSGLLIVGVTPELFFSEKAGLLGDTTDYYRDESPSQWAGQRISMLLEPQLAFYDNDTFPLFSLIEKIPVENPRGVRPPAFPVWKLRDTDIDRNNKMFWKVEDLDYYQTHAENTWAMFLQAPKGEQPALDMDAFLAGISADIEKIRARGGDVVFVRSPSSEFYRDYERQNLPRNTHWDRLIQETNAVGVHFEDHPELQGFRIPEWSHLHSDDAAPYTAALTTILMEKLNAANKR
ncbi:hypothetical protein QSV34_06715 [Porticoccus sp. W117]|uniref:hypothetical protein n=1 Tax=Porticoccus sp. W117 TaxID=3054777 RepID=UPI00259A19B6|nr:hypothetical protein [Porticoccus sp. W117]MDM3871046.1 hypothetical protein [Porticoccus sp. W117]